MVLEDPDSELNKLSELLLASSSFDSSNVVRILDILRGLQASPHHLSQAWKILADAVRDGKIGSSTFFSIVSTFQDRLVAILQGYNL